MSKVLLVVYSLLIGGLTLNAAQIDEFEQNSYNKQIRLSDAKKQDYINELSGVNSIKWFFWMTKSGRVFIADTRQGEDANSVTLWEHSLTNFTWTPISGGNVEKIFTSISISSDGRSITLTSDSSSPTTSINKLSLKSNSFTDGSVIPKKYACEDLGGSNVSPQFSWENAPKESSKFALIMDDETTPCGTGDSACIHWGLFNIPSSTTSLSENATVSGTYTDGYYGPCPPFNHTYKTTVYALSSQMPDIAYSNIPDSGMTRSKFKALYGSYILQESTISGTFSN